MSLFKKPLTRSAKLPLLALAGLPALMTDAAAQAPAVNLYTYREPGLIKPLLDAFTRETGLKVNTIFASGGLEERMRAEGASSPADVLLTVDIGRLQQARDLGVTQPVRSDALEGSIPAAYRDPDGHWFGVSARARVVYASTARVAQNEITYEELADPKWKGRVCIRSGQHLYNVSLFAAAYAKLGAARTETWLRGLKANLAKKPSGGDREVARDIAAGICDVGLGNTYYVALMRNREPDRKSWGEAVKVILPTFAGGGTHVNVAGVALARFAPNREGALKFMTFMVSDEAQRLHAQLNYEYPVKARIAVDPAVAAFGELDPDPMPIAEIGRNRKAASELVDKVGFDD